MTFLAALLALIDELLKAINLGQTGAQRAQDRQAGADALAAATAESSAETADAQTLNDVAPRDIDFVARRLRLDATSGSGGDGAGGALRSADPVDPGAAK